MTAFGVFEYEGGVARGVVAKHFSVGCVFASVVLVGIFTPRRKVDVPSVERAPIEAARVRRIGEDAPIGGVPGRPVVEVHARVVTQNTAVETPLGLIAFVERNVINVLAVEGRAVVTFGMQTRRACRVIGFPAIRVHEVGTSVVSDRIAVRIRHIVNVASVENGAHAHPHALTTGIQSPPGCGIVELAAGIVPEHDSAVVEGRVIDVTSIEGGAVVIPRLQPAGVTGIVGDIAGWILEITPRIVPDGSAGFGPVYLVSGYEVDVTSVIGGALVGNVIADIVCLPTSGIVEFPTPVVTQNPAVMRTPVGTWNKIDIVAGVYGAVVSFCVEAVGTPRVVPLPAVRIVEPARRSRIAKPGRGAPGNH